MDPLYQKFIIEGIKREQGSDFSIPAQTKEQNGPERVGLQVYARRSDGITTWEGENRLQAT